MTLCSDVRVQLQVAEGEPRSLWCEFCGQHFPVDADGQGDHWEVVTTRPLRVTPRCQPDAVVAWTTVILSDALWEARRSQERYS